jgi:catechol 2,3-dioxygenase-like lactoylglutathione lyase family enzyme
MLNQSKVICFVATTNPIRARAFYEETLGLRLTLDDPFAMVFELKGTMLRVVNVGEVTPAKYTVLGWQVGDIRAAIQELMGKGVSFERYESMPQDELGVWTAPSGARVAWLRDPDGNILSLTQFE